MKSYFKEDHGDYYALPFDDAELKGVLETKCHVQGIPMLCVIKTDGTCVHKDGRADVSGSTSPADILSTWKSQSS